MQIERTKKFDSIAQRILYGLNFIYSDFAPIESEEVTVQSQRKLHTLMGQFVDKLYQDPSILSLPYYIDETFASGVAKNENPVLNEAYKSVFKEIFEFYKFLYIAALNGEINSNILFITVKELKDGKASFTQRYDKALFELGIKATKDKNGVTLNADNDILKALKLLANAVPMTGLTWAPYALAYFARCSFSGNSDYLLERIDKIYDYNGLLIDLKNKCLEKGYKQEIQYHFGTSDLCFTIKFANKIGGFLIGYNPQQSYQFYFGTMNGIGEKAIIEDFDNLDNQMKEFFFKICRKCTGCLNCTLNRKIKPVAVNVNYDGKDYNLCTYFPSHLWQSIDEEHINILFKYHDLQEKYGKKK